MYQDCSLCPRRCHVNREKGKGACHVGAGLILSRAALHMWEEPCISGEKGSGAVFFSGCSLGCVFCQNYEISGGKAGMEVSTERLVEIFFELKEQGANNINLVTADHYILQVCEAIKRAKARGFDLPVVYNCSGYENVDTLRLLEGLVDVYLPDFKYWESETAARYSNAPDYPEVARGAIEEMVRQTGECTFDADGIIQKGVIVRHLLLPGKVKEAGKIVRYLYETYKDKIFISLMNQYTPVQGTETRLKDFPELHRKVTGREYDRWIQYVLELGVSNAYVQEGETAQESFIPAFNLEGVKNEQTERM